ncbi:MAG: hypothetical protein L6V93_01760 [Clostridiales bacterium]|nr:MAG: hypothetical protein L6V93_01760 [Clostridiales bacterium]
MEPYCESTENPDYLEFEDHTDELKDEYENKSVDCIKLPGGRIVSIHNSIVYGKYTVHNGMVYQKRFGQLKHEKRSKTAKKMTALTDYPYKKLYKSFKDFAELERYMDYNDEYEGYGYVYNPDAFYDWYCIGGRWPKLFLIKEDCTDFTVGDRDYPDEYYKAPDGYKWAAAARKKDIQWKEMNRCFFDDAIQKYKRYKEIFETGVIPENEYFQITDNSLKSFGSILYQKGETLSEFLTRIELKEQCKHTFSQYIHAYLQDGIYHCYDECQRDGDVNEMWRTMVDEFYTSLDDDTVLVSVDCHI